MHKFSLGARFFMTIQVTNRNLIPGIIYKIENSRFPQNKTDLRVKRNQIMRFHFDMKIELEFEE